MDNVVTDYRFELVEDHHSAGSGRYGLLISLPKDISGVMPFLNSVLQDTRYDHENHILIGRDGSRGFAFRPHEIRIGAVADPNDAADVAREAVELVNRVWAERERIPPSLRERSAPPVYEIYRHLPRTNCKQCGSQTCLAFAARLRAGEAELEQCPTLGLAGHAADRQKIAHLLAH